VNVSTQRSSASNYKKLQKITRNPNATSSKVEYRQTKNYTESCPTVEEIRTKIFKPEGVNDYTFTDE